MMSRLHYLFAIVYIVIGWAYNNPTYDTVAAIFMLMGFMWEKRK